MTREELFTLVDETLNEATGAAAVVKVKDEIARILTLNETLTVSNQTLQDTNNSLRDTNAQLAIRVTKPISKQDEKDEPETPEEAFEGLVNKIKEG